MLGSFGFSESGIDFLYSVFFWNDLFKMIMFCMNPVLQSIHFLFLVWNLAFQFDFGFFFILFLIELHCLVQRL